MNNKIVIFDWDDTLFPTAEFVKQLFGDKFDKKAIAMLSQKALAVIEKSISLYGASNTFIVTNGMKGWIEKSLKQIIEYCSGKNIQQSFGKILQLISNNKISAISAQYWYGQRFPYQTTAWKIYTFDAIAKIAHPDTFISIGDSTEEYMASECVKYRYSIKMLHRIKLKENPKISEMNQQFDFILDKLPCYYKGVDIDCQQHQQSVNI